MSDTKQGVKWALVQGCPLRQPDDWSNPTLSRAQTYSRCATRTRTRVDRSSGIQEGICVTSVSIDAVPLTGFVIEEEFAAAGGAAGLHELCGNCPANAALDGLAGCTGWFSCSPYSEELDGQLRELAEELGFTEALTQEFPATELLWFGFWMNSPLSLSAMQILIPLLEVYIERHLSREQVRNRRESQLLAFVRAMERAQYYNLELRVEMARPGHADLGWHTTFAHCRRCKAGAPVQPWKKVRHVWLTCGMCGHEFDPALTVKRVPLTVDGYELRDHLGDRHFRSLSVSYLISRGRELDYATAVVDKHLAPPDPAMLEKRRLRKIKRQEKSRLISTVLCAGFERMRPDADPVGNRNSRDYLLTLEQAETLLQRARQWGAVARFIYHHSQDDDLDGLWASPRQSGTPEAALQDLVNQGCSELFSVSVDVPDEALEAWKAQQSQPD